jgi:hypothetical protein
VLSIMDELCQGSVPDRSRARRLRIALLGTLDRKTMKLTEAGLAGADRGTGFR